MRTGDRWGKTNFRKEGREKYWQTLINFFPFLYKVRTVTYAIISVYGINTDEKE